MLKLNKRSDDKMNDIEGLIVKAIKIEALNKPDEKIIIGDVIITYRQFAEMLNSKNHENVIKDFLKTAVKLFNENPVFKENILKLASQKI
jgi:hypothetical protein